MPCVRSAACGSSDCPATAHRQRLLVGELHPPTSLPSHARQAVSKPTGHANNDTFGVPRLAVLSQRLRLRRSRSLFPLPLHHAATIACQRTVWRASRLVRGSASPPCPGLGQPKAIRTSSALR